MRKLKISVFIAILIMLLSVKSTYSYNLCFSGPEMWFRLGESLENELGKTMDLDLHRFMIKEGTIYAPIFLEVDRLEREKNYIRPLYDDYSSKLNLFLVNYFSTLKEEVAYRQKIDNIERQLNFLYQEKQKEIWQFRQPVPFDLFNSIILYPDGSYSYWHSPSIRYYSLPKPRYNPYAQWDYYLKKK